MKAPCKIWTGARNRQGYGVTSYGGRWMFAHRRAWLEAYGEIPEGMCVCHSCDVVSCWEPSHLFLGTRADNSADMARKGRAAKGEHHGNSKKQAWEISHMRDLYAFCGVSRRELGYIFGITDVQAGNIVSGRHWKHVPGGVL